MKAHPEGQKFKYFFRHAFVYRDKSDGLDCNETCHTDIICALVHITEENFKDCLVEQGVIEDLPTKPTPIIMTTTTTTSTKTTSTTTTSTITKIVLKP